MKIKRQTDPLLDFLYFDDELYIKPSHVEDVVEIFKTPLTGSYNWITLVADNRKKALRIR